VSPTPIKLNLGSGLLAVPGWINVDLGVYTPLRGLPRFVLRWLHRRSAWRKQMTPDQYVAAIKENRFIRRDLRRALPFKDGSVDDAFSSHCLDQMTPAEADALLYEIFRVLRRGGLLRLCLADLEQAAKLYARGDRPAALERLFPAEGLPRRWMYDFEELAAALRRAGFHEIERHSFGVGKLADAPLLDQRPDQSLFVEATRP